MNRILAIVAVVGLVAACGPSKEEYEAALKDADDCKAQLAELEKTSEERITELENENAQLKDAIAMLQGEKFDLEKLVAKLEEAEMQAKKRLETFENMIKQFQALIDAGKLKVKIKNGKMVLELPSAILFPSGSAKLDPGFFEVMDKISSKLANTPGDLVVAGHTDDVPISTSRFRSNWELSAGRAVTVAHALLSNPAVEQSRVLVEGHAETKPLVPNDSRENRALNRRVELVIVRKAGDVDGGEMPSE